MDIKVNELNKRLSVQLPLRLPLGLVFVTGRVEDLSLVTYGKGADDQPNGRFAGRVRFELVEERHRLRCELSARAAGEVDLDEGDIVRAGGHLIFDVYRAEYFLLTRDIDIIGGRADSWLAAAEPGDDKIGRTALTPFLADIKRRSEAVQEVPDDIPVWVQKIAPPDFLPEEVQNRPPELSSVIEPEPLLTDKMVAYLSQAMDSEEVVELTPSLLAQLRLSLEITPPLPEDQPTVLSEFGQPTAVVSLPPSRIMRQQPDRLLSWFLFLVVIMVMATLVAVVILLSQ